MSDKCLWYPLPGRVAVTLRQVTWARSSVGGKVGDMKAYAWWLRCAIGLVVLVGMLSGCEYSRLKEERDAFYMENQELHQRLREARTAAGADRQGLLAQIAKFDARPQLAPPIANPTGFTSIEGIETETSAGQITVRVPGDVLFDSGRTTLKSGAKKTLDQIAGVIKRDYPTNTIRIVGYTDSDPIRRSKWKDNLALSQERAAAVHRFLQQGGIDPKRLETVGRGPWHPRSTKALSRRVEIIVVLQ